MKRNTASQAQDCSLSLIVCGKRAMYNGGIMGYNGKVYRDLSSGVGFLKKRHKK